MSGFFRNSLPAVIIAIVLAIAGVVNWGVSGAESMRPTVLLDVSRSCALPENAPSDGIRFDDSDIIGAVQRAVATGASRVVVWTDGCDIGAENSPSINVPVHVVLLPRRDAGVFLQIIAPARAAVGESFGVKIEVGRTAGPGAGKRSFEIGLERDGKRLGRAKKIALERGKRATISFFDRLDRPGVVRYRAVMPGGGEAFVRVGERPHVAIVGPAPPWKEFHFVDAAAELPVDAFLVSGDLADAHIAAAVRGGAGLLALGAPKGLDLLPLTPTPPGGRAALILLDVSGSMEPHLPALREAFLALCAELAPEDKVAIVRFRGETIEDSGWRAPKDAAAAWAIPIARGNTDIKGALQRASEILPLVAARHRRLYVLSDGEWESLAGYEMPKSLASIHRAAILLGDAESSGTSPQGIEKVFPFHVRAEQASKVTEMILRLERSTADRLVPRLENASAMDVPAWLSGAIPEATTLTDVLRLYPNGRGERVAFGVGDIPVIASREEGGRIVQVAAPRLATPALLRAVIADAGRVTLEARRVGRGLLLRAIDSAGAAFIVGHDEVRAHVRNKNEWGARIETAPSGSFVVRCAGARVSVPSIVDREESGLFPNERFAAALARVSGGRLLREAPTDFPGDRGPAVHITLLASLGFLLLAAWIRSR